MRRIAAAGCLLMLAAGVAVALASSQPRLSGSNDLRLFHTVLLPAGGTLCQGPELVPGDSARIRFVVSHAGDGPPLAVRVEDRGATVTAGRLAGGYGSGTTTVELAAVADPLVAERVCIENRGDEPLTLHGERVGPEQAARVDGAAGDGRLRLEWLRAGEESWFELAPAVLHRFGLGKADWLGSWTLVLAALLVLATWIAAMRLLVRGGRR